MRLVLLLCVTKVLTVERGDFQYGALMEYDA
jgi:hypothetical protein